MSKKTMEAITLWEATHKYGASYASKKSEKSLLREWQEERASSDWALAFGLDVIMFVLMTGAH